MSASPKPRANAQLCWRWMPLNAALVAELRDEWEDLAEHASDPNVFAMPTYIEHSLSLLAEQKPCVLTLYRDGLLIGLALLRRDVGYAKLPLSFVKSALHPEQYLCTLMVRAGMEEAFASGFCAWLDSAPVGIFFVNLKLARTSSASAVALVRHCQAENRPFLKLAAFERAAIFAGDERQEPFDAHLSVGRRKSVRRAWNGLSKLGKLHFQRLERGDELQAWLDGFLAMENSGWKGESNSSILASQHETQLYRHIVSEAFAKGDLHFTRLCLDDRPIAYTLDLWRGDQAFCLKSAYDEQYRKYSPGVLMEHEALKFYAAHERIKLVDSCSAPDNELLNELWPDHTELADILIGRTGWFYRMVFSAMKLIKRASISSSSRPQ